MQICYFSRGGVSRGIAVKIGEKTGVESVAELTDGRSWRGVLGFLKGGYYSSKRASFAPEQDIAVNPDSLLLIVSPIWAGGPPPVVRGFLKRHDSPKQRIALLYTSSGPGSPKYAAAARKEFPNISDVQFISGKDRFGDGAGREIEQVARILMEEAPE